jgi:type IV pilus assembly protein PilP
MAPAPTATAELAEGAPVPEVSYSYNPVAKRDPFRNPFNPWTACCLPEIIIDCNGPLCVYNLEELKVSGVISGTANPVAVVEGPQGRSYSVYQGSKVGRNGGVVKRVLRDSIVVAEIVRDGQGVSHEYETVLRVKTDPPMALSE